MVVATKNKKYPKSKELALSYFLVFLFLIILVLILLAIDNFSKFKLRQANNTYTPTNTSFQYEPITARIKIPVILYHYVEYVKDKGDFIRKGLDTNPQIFEDQLKTLKENNYQMYFVKEVPDIYAGKILYSSQSAVLTFDDGYEDFYTDAYPLLKKYQTKATIYLVNNFIGKKNYLNEKQIQEIVQSGLVEIGAHSLDHLNLASSSALVARKQIFESKKLLEETYGIEVKTFAYPYGAFNQKTQELVKNANYVAAVSVITGAYHSSADIYSLSRIRPGIFAGKNIVKVIEELKDKPQKN